MRRRILTFLTALLVVVVGSALLVTCKDEKKQTTGLETYFGTESEYLFASLGEEKKLPSFNAVSQSGEPLTYTVALTAPDGTSAEVANGAFTPEQVGVYTYTATLADGQKKEVKIEVGESADYKNLLARMGRAEAKESVVNTFGVIASVNTEDRAHVYGTESGSLRLTSTVDSYIGGTFQLQGFSEPNISDCDSFYFYMYNDAPINIRLTLNQVWTKTDAEGNKVELTITLKSKQWTPVLMTDYTEFCARSAVPLIKDNFSAENLNGLLFNYDAVGEGLPEFDMYISDIYRIYEPTLESINAKFAALPNPSGVELTQKAAIDEQISRLNVESWLLSDADRAKVNDSKAVQLQRKLFDLANADVKPATLDEDVVVAFNSEYGLRQTSVTVSPSGDMTRELSSAKAFGNEGKSMHLYMPASKEKEERWNFDIYLNYPSITDFTGENDLFYVWVYNNSESEHVYYGWLDSNVGWTQPIKSKQWTMLYVSDLSALRSDNGKVTSRNITGAKLTFAAGTPVNKNGDYSWNANAEVDLYFSCVRALNVATIENRLDTATDNTLDSLEATLSLYKQLKMENKKSYTSYNVHLEDKFNAVVNEMKADIVATTTEEQLQDYNQELYRLEHVYQYVPKSVQGYCQQKYDSLKATFLEKVAGVASISEELKQDALYHYARIQTTQTTTEFDAKCTQWLADYGLTSTTELLQFSSSENAKFQVSARLSKLTESVVDADDVWGDSRDINTVTKVDSSAFAYGTYELKGIQESATKLTVPTLGEGEYGSVLLYWTLPKNIDLTGKEELTFSIYNGDTKAGNQYSLALHNAQFVGGASTVVLTKGNWTEIKISVDSFSKTKGICLAIRNQNWEVNSPAELYFSSVTAN